MYFQFFVFNILLNSFLRIGVSVSQNICFLRMSYVYSKSVNSLFYGGTAILSGLLYGSYYFDQNVVWKQDIRLAKEDIITELTLQTDEIKLDVNATKQDIGKIKLDNNTIQNDVGGITLQIGTSKKISKK